MIALRYEVSYSAALVTSSADAFALGVLCVPLWWATGRESRGAVREASKHVGLAFCFAAGWFALYFLSLQWALGRASVVEMYLASGMVYWQLLDVLIKYGFVAAVFSSIRYQRRLRAEDARAAALQLAAREAELGALRAQLAPHFLCNALGSVSALMGSDPERARSMNRRLGDLVRFSFDSPERRFVRLGEELEFVRSYLDIEQLRFGPRLTYRQDVPEELREAVVPAMLLQPLVENAVRYGVAPAPGGASIALRAFRQADLLVVEVADTGSVLRHDDLEAMLSGGVGISNTRRRLQHLHPGGGALELRRNPGGGLIVRAQLPWRIGPVAAPFSAARLDPGRPGT